MQMVQHELLLEGPRAGAGHPPSEVVAAVLGRMAPLVAGAASMAFRRATSVRGPIPSWLRAATDVRLVDVARGRSDSTVLVLEGPRLGDAAREVYKQLSLFESTSKPAEDETAVDLLTEALSDVRAEKRESERFDTSLLGRVERFKPAFALGLDDIVINSRRKKSTTASRIDPALTESARKLYRSTPPAQRVRVSGKLDMIRDSDRVFALIVDGAVLRGIWFGDDMASLSKVFRENVTVEGRGVFRPSGALLRVEAQSVVHASSSDDLFRRVPSAAVGPIEPIRSHRKLTGSGRGFDAIFGRWPGEEQDEELEAALRDLS